MSENTVAPDVLVTANLLSRLDRLPMTRTALLTTILVTVIWVAEGFETGVIGPILLLVKEPWGLSAQGTAQLGIASTAGIIVGAALAGRVIDRYGRKVVLLWGVSLFSLFSALCAVSADVGWIMAMRLLGGLALGAVFPIPYLMLSELLGTRSRARMIAAASAMLALSYLIPQAAALAMVGHLPVDLTWRILFLLGALPILAVPFISRYLPESPRWLLLKGRGDDARELVERMEREAGYEHDNHMVHPGIAAIVQAEYDAGTEPGDRRSDLLRRPLLSRFFLCLLICAGASAGTYVLLVYASIMYADMGMSAQGALVTTIGIMIAGAVGAISVGQCADRLGRKKTFLVYSLGAIFGFGLLALSHNIAVAVVCGLVSAFFCTGLVPFTKLFTSEQFPTHARGTAAGFVESASRCFGGVLVVASIPFIQTNLGTSAPFWFISAIFVLCLGPVMLRARETRGMSIDQAGAV
ncbi:MFS transporter [Rhodococcus oxybenzonivorans]|uniref:MFS transporter n=1 Tax=Rhodococcus oxybenzonivorans TaxID=1990687 RepID=UPI002953C7C6|nr:MFS transporter [Rhodococcus oxybenzonivorans]MDV7352177.1 MFS transporter [Rhodococcus oxybenzonivorans]